MAVVARKWEICAWELNFSNFATYEQLLYKFEEVKKSTLQRLSEAGTKYGESEIF